MSKGVVKRVIVTPDKHFPLHDQPSINVLKQTIEIVKPDAYVDLGDVGEWEAFSAWKYKRKKAPPLEFLIKDFEKDVKDVNEGMDQIDESLDVTKIPDGKASRKNLYPNVQVKYMFIVSTREIKAGHELTANYNLYTYPKTGIGIQAL